MNQKVSDCLNYIRSITDFKPKVALVLGSGLGSYSNTMTNIECAIAYKDIPGFPVSTISGHAGRYVMGYIHDVPTVIMDGRVHYYEGYNTQDVVLPIRVMHALGAEILFLSNAVGGINDDFKPGTLVNISDHISLFVPNPLLGPNDPDEGTRFPDMSQVYDVELRTIIRKAANQENILLKRGVYCQLTGPSFETPAEIRLLKTLGADMVGMSTVIEAITARHAGMRVCGVSLVTNYAAGIRAEQLNHEEVKAAGVKAQPMFARLVSASIEAMKDI